MTQEEMQVLQGMFEAERKHTAQMFEAERKHTAQMMEEKIKPKKNQLKEMQEDISYIREKVDIAYTWVDGIDLRLKAVEKGKKTEHTPSLRGRFFLSDERSEYLAIL